MTKEKKAVEEFRKRLIGILGAGLELSRKCYEVQHPNERPDISFLQYIRGIEVSIKAIKEMKYT